MAQNSEDLDSDILKIYGDYKKEAEQARFSRLEQNKVNFDCYHLRQDFSGKQSGQSAEFLPKLSMAVEQSANFMQQGLVDIGDWFKIYPAPGLTEDAMRVKSNEIMRLLQRQLEKAKFMTQVGDATKLGLLGSLMIAKVGGQLVPKPKFEVSRTVKNGAIKKRLIKKEDKKWQMKIDLVRQEDFYIDPTGKNLYQMQDVYLDYHEVEALAKGPDAIYDLSVVEENLKGRGVGSGYKDFNRNRESGQDHAHSGRRHRIKLTEIWGTFLSDEGEVLYENCVATVANDTWVIQRPTPNPLWHGEAPFVVCPILTVPGSVWGKALMDAPAMLNQAINEMFNLILDGGMMAVHGIKQCREHWLQEPTQLEDGVMAGTTLLVNSSCPPGATVLERVDTATVPADGINVYNLLNQEFTTSALTNDLRMGVQPFRQVKATEIVESSQAITSMFTGLAKHIEADWIVKILEKGWAMCAQHMDDLDDAEVGTLLGYKRAAEIQAMGAEELFAETVQGCKFEVFGISATLNKQKDFTKLQGLLQTIAASPILMEEFTRAGGDFGKLTMEIIKSLDINWYKIQSDEAAQNSPTNLSGTPPPPNGPQGIVPGEMPNDQSQIPQAGSNQDSAIPTPKFPESRATPIGGLA